jgi:hypothetical protein
MRPPALLRLLALCLAILVVPQARAVEVDLELVLLADASGSIDADEIAFQRRGYAEALTDPAVIAVIRGSLTGRIALTYIEWATDQGVVVDWTLIDGPEAAADFAARLVVPPRMAFGRNAIGAALLRGKAAIEGSGFEGLRRVIDFSGDSANNWTGPPVAAARAEVLAAGITINGLPILCLDCASGPAQPNLLARYEAEIIGGPGAFAIAVEGRDQFVDAVRRKLILEIAGGLPGDAAALD